jgi:hypothetical protein
MSAVDPNAETPDDIDSTDLDGISGGLNPQPLPPGREQPDFTPRDS